MIIGIDPGISGAIALIDDTGYVALLLDMPTIKPGKRQRVNAAALSTELEGYPLSIAYVEQVGAMPGQGTASMFSFGHSAGVIDGILAALNCPVEYVTPQRWKKHFLLGGKDKEAARAKAIQLYPAQSLGRKKDIGRAEALLIARYGFDQTFKVAA